MYLFLLFYIIELFKNIWGTYFLLFQKYYIINAGGNVKVGKAYNKEYYVVGITNPDNTSNIFTKVNINNLSVVTSGNYQRYCDIDNIRYSHIINPITKKPSNYMKSVTVITKSSLLADIYSTYLYLLPVDKGLEVVNNNNDIERSNSK